MSARRRPRLRSPPMMASSRPSQAIGPERPLELHAHRRLELYPHSAHVTADARHDQHVEVLTHAARTRQRVPCSAER